MLLALAALVATVSVADAKPKNFEVRAVIDTSSTLGPLQPFWQSAGFCPPSPHPAAASYDLSEDQWQNLITIGGIPNRTPFQIRVHWLLELVTLNATGAYNFTNLDAFFDRLVANRLKPGFELMGNPSGKWSNFEDSDQVHAWRTLIVDVVQHCVERYGLDEVAQWRFETWNEPGTHDFDTLNMTIPGWLNYYDACSDALLHVSSRLTFGGPGDGIHSQSSQEYFTALMNHCTNGTNYFTGEKGVRIDYIALHVKGHQNAQPVFDNFASAVKTIQQKWPQLASKVEFLNDEGDPKVTWSHPYPWRGDIRYPAMMAYAIVDFANHWINAPSHPMKDAKFSLLSNDNAFLNFGDSFFDMRTLVTRFQYNLTQPRSVKTVPKASLLVHGMLALLGNTQVKVSQSTTHLLEVVLLSTMSGECSATLALYSQQSANSSAPSAEMTLRVSPLPTVAASLPRLARRLTLDAQHGNPVHPWSQMGSPVYPTASQLETILNMATLRTADGPHAIPTVATEHSFNFTMQLPSIHLIQICSAPPAPPARPSAPSLHRASPSDILLSWPDIHHQSLLTYNVYLSTDNVSYTKINKVDSLFSTFWHTSAPSSGSYKVQAIDMWKRESEMSEPTHF